MAPTTPKPTPKVTSISWDDIKDDIRKGQADLVRQAQQNGYLRAYHEVASFLETNIRQLRDAIPISELLTFIQGADERVEKLQ